MDPSKSKTKTPTPPEAANPPRGEAAVTLNSEEIVYDDTPAATDSNTGTAARSTNQQIDGKPILSEESPHKQQTDKLQQYQFDTTGETPNAYQQKPAAKRLSLQPAPQKHNEEKSPSKKRKRADDLGDEPMEESNRLTNLEMDEANEQQAVPPLPKLPKPVLPCTIENHHFTIMFTASDLYKCKSGVIGDIGITLHPVLVDSEDNLGYFKIATVSGCALSKGLKVNDILKSIDGDDLFNESLLAEIHTAETPTSVDASDAIGVINEHIKSAVEDVMKNSRCTSVMSLTFERQGVKYFNMSNESDDIYEDDANITFEPKSQHQESSDPSANSGIYLRLGSSMSQEARKKFNRFIIDDPDDEDIYTIAEENSTFRLGVSIDVPKRIRGASTELCSKPKWIHIPCPKEVRWRLEHYWLYTLSELKKRRGRKDFFSLNANDIRTIIEATEYFVEHGTLCVRIPIKGPDDEMFHKVIDFRTFADDEDFADWVASGQCKGPHSKPKHSSYFDTKNERDKVWDMTLHDLIQYRKSHGMPTIGRLYNWLNNQQRKLKKSKRNTERKRHMYNQLVAEGFDMEPTSSKFNHRLEMVIEFRRVHNRNPGEDTPADARTKIWFKQEQILAQWLTGVISRGKRTKTLVKNGILLADNKWEHKYQELLTYQNGRFKYDRVKFVIPTGDCDLLDWICEQKRNEDNLTLRQYIKLDKVGMWAER